ncbi:MAG TPA: 2Fe-2S iron-sulfur cluster-binding protein [Anseongella sp.]|nr:2Fe-2S iron-sulfur cluster-binding protein [Anseongella sp.]
MPYSCKGGACSTCTARCTGGKVEMAVNEVLTEADIEQGLVLTCVGYPAAEKVRIEIEI